MQALCLLILAGSRLAEAQPPAKYTYWILAEGAANDFFDEEIVIGNPNAAPAQVKITLLPQDAAPIVVPTFTIAASSRYTFSVRDELPNGASVSAIVESVGTSPVPLVVERTMTWAFNQRRGGHNSPGVLATAPVWYLAEGTTGFFETYILITNPDPNQDAQVEVKYLRESSGPLTQTFLVPKNGRHTIHVNDGFDLNGDGVIETQITEPFSTVVTSTNNVNLAVERAMYWNFYEGGHESTGITAPHKTWLFAEGNTGGDASSFLWDTYLLLANPQAVPSPVTLTFFRQTGAPVVYNTTLPANSRTTVQVSELDVDKDGMKDLPSASFSTKVEAQQEIIAERAMYWSSNGITYIEGHNTPGVNAEALKWAFAEGEEGSIDATGIRYSSFFLVSNSSATDLNIKVTFVREDGKGVVKTFGVSKQSRFTIPTGTFPELSHQRFSTFIESTNNVPFVAERAVYWGPGFYGGHASVGTPWDAAIAEPPVLLLSPVVNSVSPNNGLTTGGTDVTITGSNFIENLTGPRTGTRVKFGDVDAAVTIISDTRLIATSPAVASPGTVSITVSNAHINPAWLDVTRPNAFTYNPPEPLLETDLTLAFGDSITYGTTSVLCDLSPNFYCTTNIPDQAYAVRLRNLLRARYPKQTDINVVNAGISGECVFLSGCQPGGGNSGGQRFLNLLESGDASDLVVILEGVNDLNHSVSIPAITDRLRQMIESAKSQGKKVILSSLTPVKAPLDHVDESTAFWKADPFRVANLNVAIDALAAQQGVPRVNMFAAFGSGSGALDCNFTPSCRALLSPDGLHPNAAGYSRMADVINAKIVEQFEVR